MLGVIIGAVIGIIGSIGTAIWIEWLRRPHLELSIESPPLETTYLPGMPASTGRALRLVLHNKPLGRWIRWMAREPALQCRATIGFHHLDNQDVFGRLMKGRWASSPEPFSPALSFGGVTVTGPVIALGRVDDGSRIDVYPGVDEVLDIAVRFDGEPECYGWNTDAYFADPVWRNANWRLGPGRYLVKVIVSSSGPPCSSQYRLINDVPRNAFRLELA